MLSDATKHSFELAKLLPCYLISPMKTCYEFGRCTAEASKNHNLAEMQIWKHAPSSSIASVQVFLTAMFLAVVLFNFSSSFL